MTTSNDTDPFSKYLNGAFGELLDIVIIPDELSYENDIVGLHAGYDANFVQLIIILLADIFL
jgi:hypothetical protein